jgi:hypothetical protein
MTPRELILSEILEERTLQESRHRRVDPFHEASAWIALISRHAGLAIGDGAVMDDPVRFRRQMVRVASLALAAIELHDAKYPPSRAVGQPPEERTSK